MNIKLFFSSESDEWETPQGPFDELHEEFRFTLDVCATKENAKLPKFFTIEDNGLLQNWSGTCWCNPPYSKPERACKDLCTKKACPVRGFHLGQDRPGAIDWVKKAYWESRTGVKIVMLLPVRTDVEYFHKYIWDEKRHKLRLGKEIRFLKGRLKFGDSEHPAPFPSMIVIFNPIYISRNPIVQPGCGSSW